LSFRFQVDANYTNKGWHDEQEKEQVHESDLTDEGIGLLLISKGKTKQILGLACPGKLPAESNGCILNKCA
jgi:hypothetical protein